MDLTPWELRNGLWYKREDAYRAPNGVNGSKFRACRHLIETARAAGATSVVTAQSVQSPQAAIVATIAEELGMGCTVVVGASKPETAVRHPSIRIAVEAGAFLDCTPRVAYNPVIQPYARRLAEETGAYQVPYAISPASDASPFELQGFLSVGAIQVENTPADVRTLVIPFGSGNTAAGVIFGLALDPHNVERIVLVGVGPDRLGWLYDRFEAVGLDRDLFPFQIDHQSLHGWFADYGDRMPESRDGIDFHPTYEGKVVRYLDQAAPSWWTRRDGTTGFWIVGGSM